ncbi:uncharacterized protein LOC119455127 [Dermacentor silvarum]|uniref:uncharacterized protein LOC119455127 n=1 Tax=Dermacentor silvarum TaxID=543639 RepID=UPI00189B89BA|nr:uncharacterized protein LOC119455127 [Dermacentor silvarum]
MGPVVVVIMVLCITSVAVDGNAEEPSTVDAMLDKLKEMVKEIVPDKAKMEMFIEKIESARECLNMTEGIREQILKKIVASMVPTFTECGSRIKDITEPKQKKSTMKACFEEKARKFKESSGMNEEEITMLQETGKCIKEKVQL